MIDNVKLPKPGEVWQGFGKTIYMCVELHFNHSRDLALVGLSAPAVHKTPWLAELSLNRQLWEFYLEEGKAIKVVGVKVILVMDTFRMIHLV